MPPLLKPLTSHPRLARLGVVVGALLCALPVVQVLRDQGVAIDAAKLRQAEVNLMARAVDVQRGLMLHGALAGQVLRGRSKHETERLALQAEVDERLALLTRTLAAEGWPRALHEAHDLTEDWWALAKRIAARRIDGPNSDQKHRLLIEQTLQVMDLSSAEKPAGATGDLSAALAAAAAAAALYAQDTGAGATASDVTFSEAHLAAVRAQSSALAAHWTGHVRAEGSVVAASERARLPAAAALLVLGAVALAALFVSPSRRRAAAPASNGAPAAPAGATHGGRTLTRPRLDTHRLLLRLRLRAGTEIKATAAAPVQRTD